MGTGQPAGLAPGWRRVGTGGSCILVAPAGPAGSSAGALPCAPRLAQRADRAPLLALTLLLARPPELSDVAGIAPLVTTGLLGLTVRLALRPEELARAAQAVGAPVLRPLFATEALAELRGGNRTLATAAGAGAGCELALAATLEAPEALAAHRALSGIADGPGDDELRVAVRVRYRAEPLPVRVRLEGDWRAIAAGLGEVATPAGELTRTALQAALEGLAQQGKLRVTVTGPTAGEVGAELRARALGDALVRLAPLLLERVTGDGIGAEDRFRLTVPTDDLGRLRATVSLVLPGGGEAIVETSLADLVSAAGAAGAPGVVRLSCLNADGAGVVAPAPRLTRPRTQATPRARAGEAQTVAPLPLLFGARSVVSAPLVLTADQSARPTATQLLASDVVYKPVTFVQGGTWLATDVVATPVTDLPLPVVDDGNELLLPDRIRQGHVWYRPGFRLVLPEASSDPATSPFLLRFSQEGVTSGPDPRPGLVGTIRTTVEAVMPEEVRAALAERGDPPSSMVELGGLSVTLEVPFRDEATGETRLQPLVAAVALSGTTITATADVMDGWLRLAYGALAYPGFQAQPPRLRIAYAFRAYTPFRRSDVLLPLYQVRPLVGVFDPEVARAGSGVRPILAAPGDGPGPLVLVPRERLRSPTSGPGPQAARRPPRPETVEGGETIVTIDVPVHHPSRLGILYATTEYISRSVVVETAVEASYPCAGFGGLYRQVDRDGPERAIGCQDVLRLGEIRYRQYAELPALATAQLRVFRSLQQPGRFLVVPAAYRITRYAAGEGDRAYRPVVQIIARQLPEPGEARYFLLAALEPDLPRFVRRQLAEQLIAESPPDHLPVLDFPTGAGLGAATTIRWVLPGDVEEPEVTRTWSGFQVSASADLDAAAALTTLIETSGLAGTVTFTFPDGLEVFSSLILDTRVVGPWEDGPIAVTLSGTAVTLANRTSQPVNVNDLAVRAADRTLTRVPCDQTLGPGAEVTVQVPAGAVEVEPEYELVGGHLTLDQLNVFIEDITATIHFINTVRFANHDITGLVAEVRLKGTAVSQTVQLGEDTAAGGQANLTLPLIDYLSVQTVEFRLHVTRGGQADATAWRDWVLATAGNVITIIPEML
jgi:hypothetical protein